MASTEITASRFKLGMALLNLYFAPTVNGAPVPAICTAFLKSETTPVPASQTSNPEVVQTCAFKLIKANNVNERVKIFFILCDLYLKITEVDNLSVQASAKSQNSGCSKAVLFQKIIVYGLLRSNKNLFNLLGRLWLRIEYGYEM